MSLVEVIGPSSPVRGLNTSLAGPYVPPGYFEALDNLRIVTGYVVARNGSQLVASANIPSSGITYGGSETFIQDGTTKIVRVVRDTSSGKSDIYVSSDGGAYYTKITATSGPYGDTRLNQRNGTIERGTVRLSRVVTVCKHREPNRVAHFG